MKSYQLLSILFIVLFSAQMYSQKRLTGDSYNRLGIQGGVIYGGMVSNEVDFKPSTGFMGGFTTRANTTDNFIFIYGVNFFQMNTALVVEPEAAETASEIDFETTGVQLNLFFGHKLIGEHLSIEAGPVLQLNGKFTPESGFENAKIEGYEIISSDLEEISKINFNAAANISAGFPGVKLWFQYHYGLSNPFRNIDIEDLKAKDSSLTALKGRTGAAIAGMVVYF